MLADDIVREHFKTASGGWGTRYRGRPRKLSDQDLLLRRDNAHRLLRPLLESRTLGARLQVFDIGCGSGDVLDGIPRDLICVTGVDFVAEMVAAAARSHPHDRFVVADGANLPFEADSADIVVSLGVLEYVPDPAALLRSVHRVLRPGGRLIVSFPNRTSALRLASRMEARCTGALIVALDALRGRRLREDLWPRYRHTQWSVGGARRIVTATGFSVDCVLFNTFGLWGHIGTLRPNLALSEWMSRRFYHQSFLSAALATTMVVRAAKPAGF